VTRDFHGGACRASTLRHRALDVLIIGGITAFSWRSSHVQYDIKRVVAYSTLSQLGYMTVALGASRTRRIFT